jgi:ATP-dependent Clp endopeptidase proteolytic subunit ClpP
MFNKIKKKILDAVTKKLSAPPKDPEDKVEKIVLVDPSALVAPEEEPDMRIIGLFTDVQEEKVAEIVQALLYLNEVNKNEEKQEDRQPIEFYISTYGGSADDMFALYDVMNLVREETEIHTIGVGKVMSAGVLLLAGGTPGKRKIGKNCRVMIHNVSAGAAGSLPNLAIELEAIQQLQEDYVNALVSCTKLTQKKLTKMLNEKVNIYLDAEEAVRLGIADIII